MFLQHSFSILDERNAHSSVRLQFHSPHPRAIAINGGLCSKVVYEEESGNLLIRV
jgi:hypothetical protein